MSRADAEEPDRLREELSEALRQREAFRALARSAQEELSLFRRRIERERLDDLQVGRTQAIETLLPVLDDLDRALRHMPDDLADHPWARGVALLGLQLQSALAQLGVEATGEVGEPFDPRWHEAVAHEPRSSAAPDSVAEVVRPGYRAGDRLLRAAQVVVAAEGAPEPPPNDAGSEAPAGEGPLADEVRPESPPTRPPGGLFDARA